MPVVFPQGRLRAMSTDLAAKVEALESEVASLHSTLASQGLNSKHTTDLFGREFAVPVDAEHKSTSATFASLVLKCDVPHNRAFHSSWFGFFSSFFSTFAASPLMAYMEKPTSLNLMGSPGSIGTGNILSLAGNIVMRAVIGFVCDLIGPRKGLAFLLLVTSPGIFGMMFVTTPAAWIGCRAIIGFGLATFVTCQVWCSQMYNKSVVGIVNATSAGWGNLGGGVTNLVMPLIFLGMFSAVKGTPEEREDRAWRLCYIVPLCMHVGGAFFALTGRDLPDGNFKELESSGAKQKSRGGIVLRTGLTNVNAWILTATYGMCFGVELTMNSIAAKYFYNYHGLSPQTAGLLASLYGLMNLFARSLGGWISDVANKSYGMRGRLWACWLIQSIEGVFCILMGMATLGMDSPFGKGKVQGYTQIGKKWFPVNGTMVTGCGCTTKSPPLAFQELHGVGDEMRMVMEPPSPYGNGDACILHQNAVGITVFIMICFSLCVQAAEGLHYGIVPYVSRPALGIVSGMVGAGGNLGGVIALRAFFFAKAIRVDQGYIYLGIMVISITALMFLIYFPDKGGMLVPAGGLGSYDPQLIKPPSDYRGADSMDFAAVEGEKKKETSTAEGGAPISQA